MDSQSLLNGLKDLFASLGAKTSDSNYAVGLFDKTTKEPKGVMGMSDLASVLGVGQKHNIGSAEWLSITIDQSFGCIYLLGVDPSTGAVEAKIIMARDYNGDPHISGIQAHIQIKKKNNTYYFKTPPGYEARLVEITNKNCTVTTTTNVPSDATDVEINNQK